jgi:hypothetical protein
MNDEGQAIYSSFVTRVKENLLINDRTPDEWWAHFGLRIETNNLNPEICKSLLIQIANLYQEASYYYSISNASFSALEGSQSSEHTKKYKQVVDQLRAEKPDEKLPAAATIENLVKAEENVIYSAIATAKIAREFWKTILDSLNTTRKIIDTASMNNGIEAKMSQYGDKYHEGDE